jgi:hypothetical protein
LGELVPGGRIRHALKIAIHGSYLHYASDETPGYRWPASAADAVASTCYTGANPQLEMGALLALPASFEIEALGTEPAKIPSACSCNLRCLP